LFNRKIRKDNSVNTENPTKNILKFYFNIRCYSSPRNCWYSHWRLCHFVA